MPRRKFVQRSAPLKRPLRFGETMTVLMTAIWILVVVYGGVIVWRDTSQFPYWIAAAVGVPGLWNSFWIVKEKLENALKINKATDQHNKKNNSSLPLVNPNATEGTYNMFDNFGNYGGGSVG